ncbi:MAG: Monosaccharide transporter ATP-binding protein family [Aeromicrobium sp.]|jgi:ABC-type sugar transport system ATPase subunit|uniref:sugar ABC transporter ATP-binding protein n=1 Tax=Aeromicrobium sp. TaxID=1871063 RepID=UPI00261405FE|nr:sugar ABC transporter ATP-binding protein [Aeromicrobium sp.]MCW2825684.1 Monosaccharide transporter ATP-binding protein family [Aeromicrobium sp.]
MHGDHQPLLDVSGVSKSFGGVAALESVDLRVSQGAVHGVLGKNGAGKSTLMALIAGALHPDAGRIEFGGEDVTGLPLSERKDRGIHLMEQHAEVFDHLSVAENLALPRYPRRGFTIDRHTMREQAAASLKDYGLSIDPDAAAGSLNLPQQRQLCLIKTLHDGGRLAILDEPTTAMSRAERQSLFGWIRELTSGGLTFIYITHFNQDLIEICDEYTVLRDGLVVGQGDSMAEMTGGQLSRLVTGGDVDEFERTVRAPSDTRLKVRGLRVDEVDSASFDIGRGEVVGLVGLPGSGARSVARALGGLQAPTAGTVEVDGETVKPSDPAAALKAGIAYLTHDRIHEGVIPEFSVEENLRVGNWARRGPLGLIDRARMREGFEDSKSSLAIRVASPSMPIKALSGGNQQKVLLGRLVGHEPRVLVLDEPTAGIDVGAKEDVHRIVDGLTDAGVSVLMLAYDPSELVRLVDRVIVFHDGAIAAELRGDDLTTDNVLRVVADGPQKAVNAL